MVSLVPMFVSVVASLSMLIGIVFACLGLVYVSAFSLAGILKSKGCAGFAIFLMICLAASLVDYGSIVYVFYLMVTTTSGMIAIEG